MKNKLNKEDKDKSYSLLKSRTLTMIESLSLYYLFRIVRYSFQTQVNFHISTKQQTKLRKKLSFLNKFSKEPMISNNTALTKDLDRLFRGGQARRGSTRREPL